MADVNFQIFGANGNLQLDATNPPFVLRDKRTVTVTNGSRPVPDPDPSVPTPSIGWFTTVVYYNQVLPNPIIALRCTTAHIIVKYEGPGVDQNGTTFYSWTLRTNGPNGGNLVDCYIFDRCPNVQTAVGLNLYAADGTVIYNSDYKLLKIAAIQDSPADYIWDSGEFGGLGGRSPGSITVANGTYAGFIISPRMYYRPSGASYVPFFKEGFIIRSNGLDTYPVSIINFPGDDAIYKTSPSKMFLVDVSGY